MCPSPSYGPTPTEQLTNGVSFSFSPTENSWADHLLTQVLAQSLDFDGAGLPISAVSAEKSGGVWYLWIQAGHSKRSKSYRCPASDIQINGTSLGVFLEAIATKGI